MLYACTSNDAEKENPKIEEIEKASVSLEDFQGFWVNTVFIDSIIPERRWGGNGYRSFFFFKSIDITDSNAVFQGSNGRKPNMVCRVEGEKVLIMDSLWAYYIKLEADTTLVITEYDSTKVLAVFKRRNNWREMLNLDNCPNDLGMYGGCGYVRLFSKLVFDGDYTVIIKKENFTNSSGIIQIKENIITGIEKRPIEMYFDNYFGTIHPNGRNDAMYMVRDTTYHKSYHWRFSGDTLILHKWNNKKDSHMYDVGEIVLKMIKQK